MSAPSAPPSAYPVSVFQMRRQWSWALPVVILMQARPCSPACQVPTEARLLPVL